MADYHLERLNDENAESWDEFNDRSAEGSSFHSLRWKEILEKTTEETARYFLLFKEDAVVGLFPFVEHEIGIFKGLVPPTDPQRLPAVLESSDPLAMPAAIDELRKIRIDGKRISFVSLSTLHEEAFSSITAHPLFPWDSDGDMILDLAETPPEAIWNSFTKKGGQRKHLKRFEKDGFEIVETRSLDDLQHFYRYYEANIRRLGGTIRPFSRFTEMLDSMPDAVRITMVAKGSLVGGGLFQLLDESRKTLYEVYLSLNRDLPTTYHVSRYLDWEAINWAWEHHYDRISFGAQHLDETNPRYLGKKEFGARFKPWHSRMIPLTKIFLLSVAGTNYLDRWRAGHRRPASDP